MYPNPACPGSPRELEHSSSRFPWGLAAFCADLGVWLVFVLAFTVFRVVMLVGFFGEAGPATGAGQIANCLATGFRFDLQVATYLCLPLFGLSVAALFTGPRAWMSRASSAVVAAASLLIAMLGIVNLEYFKEYKTQFDHWTLGLIYDDRRAIFATIWKSYHVLWLGLAMVLAVWLLTFAALRVARWCGQRGMRSGRPTVARILLTLLLAVGLIAIGLRGSIGTRPLRLEDAAVCGDPLLDKLVPNALWSLQRALESHVKLVGTGGLEEIYPGARILSLAKEFNPRAAGSTNLDDYLQRFAQGPATPRPLHIFLIVMESYDAWPMLPEFASLHLTDRLQALGEKGMRADVFVSAGEGTMPSLATIITGIPDVGVLANHQPGLQTGVATAIAPVFRQLGYRTRLFYGGFLNWQRVGDFCREQGFDEVHGGPEMSDKPSGNQWGVDDRLLFDFLLRSRSEQPTFDLVMTTSCHPPFTVDLDREGFPLKQIPAELQKYPCTPEQLREFGHLWYSDRCVGEFVEKAAAQFPQALFAITGDHWSRRCLNPRPTLLERKAVPLILTGDALAHVKRPPNLAGSHLDILPTLIELCAPKDFRYFAFGRNLLEATDLPLGFGNGVLVSKNFVLDIEASRAEDPSGRPLPWSWQFEHLRLHSKMISALAWWRTMRGPALTGLP